MVSLLCPLFGVALSLIHISIAGLLAQDPEPFKAACLGVYLHGEAGDRARDRKGPYGVMARDLIEELGCRK